MKLIVVLDIDNTLIDTEIGYKSLYEGYDFKFRDGKDFYVWKRPGLDNFLKWLFDNFEVAFWSASSKDYVMNILSRILTVEQRNKCLFIWTADKCTIRSHWDDFLGSQTYVIKDLNKFWKKKKDRESLKKRIIIIDDRPTTYSRNYGNALPIDYFNYWMMGIDKELSRIREALEILSTCDNVRHIEKRKLSGNYLKR